MIIKNSNIRQYLAHNRYFILFGIIGLILLLFILGNLSNIEKEKQQEKLNAIKNKVTTSNIYNPSQTVIAGENVPKEKQEQNSNIIEEFVQYCNKKEIQKAYNLLTQECKEELYPDEKSFQTNYIDKKFSKQRQYSMQSWYADGGTYTYKITLTEDMLSTGKVSNSNTIEEYYTIVSTNQGRKLNINNYIKRTNIYQEGKSNDITIQVKSRDSYKDYEIYNVQVRNDSKNRIILDSRKDTSTVYVQGETGGKYRGLMYELAETDLIVNAGTFKEISIKVNKAYSLGLRIAEMNFTDVILNYDEYRTLPNKEDYKNIVKIKVEF